MQIKLNKQFIDNISKFFLRLCRVRTVAIIAVILAVAITTISFFSDTIVAYGDSESHLNIAKRVVSSITPGMAQLGGIWLPIPHLLMLPFIWNDWMWRTGLAGAIPSGVAYVISCIFIYKLILLLTKNKVASFVGFLVFALNPNILYMQSTPMSELPLIVFFTTSTYFFIKFIQNEEDWVSLVLSGLLSFCAVLSRYDAWSLVVAQAAIIVLIHIRKSYVATPFWERVRNTGDKVKSSWTQFIWRILPFDKTNWSQMEGQFILFATVAFLGIFMWLGWGLLILGDPLYFTNSQFSAKAQQDNWFAKGQLPAKYHLPVALIYYLTTAMSNSGMLIFYAAVIGFIVYMISKRDLKHWFVAGILMVPFAFNVLTLFIGQSVIFIPHITPVGFEWRLFNVRYGVMMVPAVAFFFAFLFYKSKIPGRLVLIILLVIQIGLFAVGYSKIISLADGVEGLSKAKRPDAEQWMKKHYDKGLVLIDDYARSISIVRSGVPMQNIIYIGNKPYWADSFKQPEKHATWIIMQKDDSVWKGLYEDPIKQAAVYTHFEKVYTSKDILIFRRQKK